MHIKHKLYTDSDNLCIVESSMQSFPEANYAALRAGVTCCSLDTINPSVQVPNQISLWQALWDYPRVLWARWAPGKPHCSLTVVGPASLAACRSLAGPGRAAEARGLPLTCSSHCQGSASTGMYGQDGSLHYTNAGNQGNRNDVHLNATAGSCLWLRGLKIQYREIQFFCFYAPGFCSAAGLVVDSFLNIGILPQRHLLRNTCCDIVCLLFNQHLFQSWNFETWKLTVWQEQWCDSRCKASKHNEVQSLPNHTVAAVSWLLGKLSLRHTVLSLYIVNNGNSDFFLIGTCIFS